MSGPRVYISEKEADYYRPRGECGVIDIRGIEERTPLERAVETLFELAPHAELLVSELEDTRRKTLTAGEWLALRAFSDFLAQWRELETLRKGMLEGEPPLLRPRRGGRK